MYGIYTYIWLIFMVNVGKYTSPMDPVGYEEAGLYIPSKIKWDRIPTDPVKSKILELLLDTQV